MSNHRHTEPARSNLLRRGLSLLLALVLLAGLLPGTVLPARAADWGWATPYLQTLIDWGVMRGDQGDISSSREISRAEFVAMMNRAYGYTRVAGNPFTDVNTWNWFYDDIDIAYNMGYFKGTSATTASPNSPLTREQAAVLLARNMMLQPIPGEVLGFTDSRSLSDWSRGLVAAAAKAGVINGCDDGSFQPHRNITQGELASLLVHALGTPVQTPGDHALGTVHGNVTVNTAGVTLRDGIIGGNLYLTGGIDLGDVTLENINVLGEIIVSGAGESHSSQSSITLRNVKADAMTVDSISNQFVTIRAEGNTDIASATVRTNAYVDDSSLTGYGLRLIDLDGDSGTLLQLAGNVQEVLNRTPDSDLQVVQGATGKITVDEYAAGSKVLVDGDARVDELNLDTGVNVTGEGDIKNLNVGAAGSTVEQLPDSITIRPGITADVNGSTMNSVQANESSADPRLLAGYPAARDVAPTSAKLVFSTNKAGTVYWAVTAVADGSVSEADLINHPTYGGRILQYGSISAASSKTEYTAAISNLTMDGSYYVSAVLVDGRGWRSPVKVTAFSTPDGTVPAFTTPPRTSYADTQEALVIGMPNKSCLLYWVLLSENAAAPTPAEIKANAVRGNWGYGSTDVTKNSNIIVKVNRGTLQENTTYKAYLWLTDYDGAQSSQVYVVDVPIPDETPPEVNDFRQFSNGEDWIEFSFTMNEPGKLHWAIVTEEMDASNEFIDYEREKTLMDAKVKVIAGKGANAVAGGEVNVPAANTPVTFRAEGLDPLASHTSNFVVYFLGEDNKTPPPGNYAVEIGRYQDAYVMDTIDPKFVEQTFNRYNESDKDHPLADTDITLVFSETVQSGSPRDKSTRFLKLYQEVERLVKAGAVESNADLTKARQALSNALYASIKLYDSTGKEVVSDQNPAGTLNADCVIDYRYAVVKLDTSNGYLHVTFPHNTERTLGGKALLGTHLQSGAAYHFQLNNIYDCAYTPRPMPNTTVEEFRTAAAQVDLTAATQRPLWMAWAKNGDTDLFKATRDATNPGGSYIAAKPTGSNQPSHYVDVLDGTVVNGATADDGSAKNDPSRVDASFRATPTSTDVDPELCYDILIWANTNIKFSLYSREKVSSSAWNNSNANSWDAAGAPVEGAAWTYEGSGQITGANVDKSVMRFTSLFGDMKNTMPDLQKDMKDKEYVIHVDEVTDGRYGQQDLANEWNEDIQFRVTFVAGTQTQLDQLKFNHSEDEYKALTTGSWAISPISSPEHLEQGLRVRFTDSNAPSIEDVSLVNSDTSPQVNVRMNRAGTVHCVAVPLRNVTYKDSADKEVKPPYGSSIGSFLNYTSRATSPFPTVDTFQILENVRLSGVGGAQPTVEDLKTLPFSNGPAGLVSLSAPSPERLTGPGDNFAEGAVKGTGATPSANAAAVVRFEKPLEPNTIYYLCVTTQGSTTASLATTSYGFWFVTNTAQRPILVLQDAGSVDVTAQVDRTANVQARLLNQTLAKGELADGTDAIFAELLGDTGNWDAVAAASGPADVAKYKDYTVLDALLNGYPTTNSNSVFDQFASADLKQRIQQIVENGSSNDVPRNTILRNWGAKWVDSPDPASSGWYSASTEFDNLDELDKSNQYIVVAVAYTSAGAPRAFRAASNLQIVTKVPPRVTSVSVNVNNTGGTLWSGIVTIDFDQTLYLKDSGTWNPMAHTSATSVTGTGPDKDYVALGKYLMYDTSKGDIFEIVGNGSSGFTKTNRISIRVTASGFTNFSHFEIALPGELCNEWGYDMSNLSRTLSFDYNQTTNRWDKTVPAAIRSPKYQG